MKKGFTLIELLVVIAIIAILAAILFPVFAQAREKARASSCLSNCKQIGTALQLYTDDYDETVPFYEDTRLNRVSDSSLMTTYAGYPISNWYFKLTGWAVGDGDCWSWADCIYPYVKNLKMFVCPSGHKDSMGYAYNVELIGGVNYIDANPNTTITIGSQQLGICQPCALAQIKSPSELIFCMDALQYSGNYWSSGVAAPTLSCGDIVTGSSFIQAVRHNGGANITYCDGHAKYCKAHQGPLEHSYSWGSGMRYWDPDYYN